jgi:hypothetical protein
MDTIIAFHYLKLFIKQDKTPKRRQIATYIYIYIYQDGSNHKVRVHVSSKQKILKYSIKFHFRSVMNIMIVFFCVFQTKQNLCVFQRCYIYQCHMEEVISLTSE